MNEKILEIVKDVINQWDPYNLIEITNRPNEFRHEIKMVVERIDEIKTSKDATKVLSEVFGEMFLPAHFTFDDCILTGEQLFQALEQTK